MPVEEYFYTMLRLFPNHCNTPTAPRIRSIFILLFAAMPFFQSCNLTGDDPIITGDEGTLSCRIDGDLFSVSGILVSAELQYVGTEIQSLAIGGAEVPFGGVTRSIALALISADSSDIAVGDVYTATSSNKIAAAEYGYDDGVNDLSALSDNTDIALIRITKLDWSARTVSGTFQFEGVDDNDPGTVYSITDGEFTDIPFD